MNVGLRSALTAGVIAAVIWTAISLLTGMPVGTALAWAVVFLVGTALITYLVQTAIVRSRRT